MDVGTHRAERSGKRIEVAARDHIAARHHRREQQIDGAFVGEELVSKANPLPLLLSITVGKALPVAGFALPGHRWLR